MEATVFAVVVQDVATGRESESFLLGTDAKDAALAFVTEKGLSLVGRLVGRGEEVGFVANEGTLVGLVTVG